MKPPTPNSAFFQAHPPAPCDDNGNPLREPKPPKRTIKQNVVNQPRAALSALTDYERKVHGLTQAGKSASEIAAELGRTPAAIYAARHIIAKKLGAQPHAPNPRLPMRLDQRANVERSAKAQDASGIQWCEPPSRGGHLIKRREKDRIVEQLKAQPGRWAIVDTVTHNNGSKAWRARGCEAVQELRDDGRIDIKARWPERAK